MAARLRERETRLRALQTELLDVSRRSVEDTNVRQKLTRKHGRAANDVQRKMEVVMTRPGAFGRALLAGAALAGISSYVIDFWPFVVLEAVWTLSSLFMLVGVLRKKAADAAA